MKNDGNFNNIKDEINNNKGLGIIACNRTGRRRGGGVAIVFDKNKLTLEEHRFKKDGIEIVVGKGNITGQKRSIFIFCIYLPPNLLISRVRHANELINREVDRIKTLVDNPIIILGGDLNQFGIANTHIDSPEILEINSPPTRKGFRLDLISSNINPYLDEIRTLAPLESEACPSDHDIFFFLFIIGAHLPCKGLQSY